MKKILSRADEESLLENRRQAFIRKLAATKEFIPITKRNIGVLDGKWSDNNVLDRMVKDHKEARELAQAAKDPKVKVFK